MKTLQILNSDHITHVILNRAEVHNAFNEDMMRELSEVFGKIQNDERVRCVILTAQGKSFSAGGDLNYMKSAAQKNHQENVNESLAMAKMFALIDECPKPVVGIINGSAFGGGLGLVSVCDVVLCDQKAQFGFSEVRLGLTPSVISPFVIQKIGVSQARRFFVTGERFDAHKAKQMGLVHEIFDDASKDSVVSHLLSNILANGPEAIDQAKVLIRKNQELKGTELTEFTAEQISKRRASQEAQEGITAFFEKRKAGYNQT
ncbi:MAG: enoyl-CoA hydratase/isomerase family protein [Deltaproteobacteria bacterium]|nr:enoyl-CoA hydratase/isomerase family protein [Deltaproteobacteria bacterium]